MAYNNVPVPGSDQNAGGNQGNKGGTWKGVVGGAVAGTAVSAALVGALMGTGVINTKPQAATSTPAVAAASADGTTTQSVNLNTSSEDVTIAEAVAAKCLPSVVAIHVEGTDGASGIGSGVILDTDGNIITNWHVAGDAQTISVTIEGKSYPATLVGGDASSDIAVIHAELNGATVTPIEIGDSTDLVPGDWVMTIGSPLGLDQSVSAGIVSALYRNQLMTGTSGNTLYTNLIQVDAAINGGNSGGALVNSKGQLIGINTLYANASGMEVFSGIGFAIPGNYAVEIANKVIAGEQVTHAYIGLSCATVNAQNAQANHLSVNQGAYVAEVVSDGPGATAGIEVGDIITRIGEHDVTSSDGFILAVRSYSVGDVVEVTVMRGSEEKKFMVELGSDEELQAQQEEQRKAQEEAQQQYMQQYEEFLRQYQEQYSWPWDSYSNDLGF